MCRKDFTGYICGHCSLPKIVPCPITLSNPSFPLCKFIAEIPMQVTTLCDACNRVAFNQDILLKEKIHMEEHKKKRCPCGFDYTEEERQNTARLRMENEKRKTFGNRIDYVSDSRYETLRISKSTQGDYSPLNGKQSSDQQPQFPKYVRNLDQYMNAPYGRHPLHPVPTDHIHHPYHSYQPQHELMGSATSPMNDHWQSSSGYPFSREKNNGDVMTLEEPIIGMQEDKFARVSDYESANDEGFGSENYFASSTNDSLYDKVNLISSPVAVNGRTISPFNQHSPPSFGTVQDW